MIANDRSILEILVTSRAVLKRILFRTNIRRNSSGEYLAETNVAKLAHYSSYEEYLFLAEHSVFCQIFGHFTEYWT